MNTPAYDHAMRRIAALNPHAARAALMSILDTLYAKGEGSRKDPNRIDLSDPNPVGVEDIFGEITGLYLNTNGETVIEERAS